MLKMRHVPRDEEPPRKDEPKARVVVASAIALLVLAGVAHPSASHNQAMKYRHEPMGPTTSTS